MLYEKLKAKIVEAVPSLDVSSMWNENLGKKEQEYDKDYKVLGSFYRTCTRCNHSYECNKKGKMWRYEKNAKGKSVKMPTNERPHCTALCYGQKLTLEDVLIVFGDRIHNDDRIGDLIYGMTYSWKLGKNLSEQSPETMQFLLDILE